MNSDEAAELRQRAEEAESRARLATDPKSKRYCEQLAAMLMAQLANSDAAEQRQQTE
jgi:hypothetical protein